MAHVCFGCLWITLDTETRLKMQGCNLQGKGVDLKASLLLQGQVPNLSQLNISRAFLCCHSVPKKRFAYQIKSDRHQTCDFTQALWVRLNWLNSSVIWCFRNVHTGLPGANNLMEFGEWNTWIMSFRAYIVRDFCPSKKVRSKRKLIWLRTKFHLWKCNMLRNVCLSGTLER